MPTITIDIPDNALIPTGWDAQSFMLSKMAESGMMPKPDTEKRVRITDLWGSGAGLWPEGADEFIRKERESWEEREAAWN